MRLVPQLAVPALCATVAALASVSTAQTFEPIGDDTFVTDIPLVYEGTLDLATGALTPPSGFGARAIPGVAYDNTCWPYAVAPCNLVFINSVTVGQTRVDDGRMPSRTSPSPNVGTMDAYRITKFQVAYYTSEDDTSIGGPGARINVRFWEDLDRCTNLSTAPAPTASFALTLPGSLMPATVSGHVIDINLTGGFEFTMKADANGSYDGTQQLDNFAYGFNVTTVTAGRTNYIIRAGQLPPNNGACAVGDGTYFLNPGTPSGTGLDNDNSYWLQSTATTGTCFTGATSNTNCAAPQNGPVFGGYHMELTADLTDCNGNGLPDADDISTATSTDVNANGIPDECECGVAPAACGAGTSVNGCTSGLSTAGTPSATALSGFTVTATGMDGQRNGGFFYGLAYGPIQIGTGTSFFCGPQPRQRIGPFGNTGGTNGGCDGSRSRDVNDWLANHPGQLGGPFAFGQTLYIQSWNRDGGSPSNGINTSDGIAVTLCP